MISKQIMTIIFSRMCKILLWGLFVAGICPGAYAVRGVADKVIFYFPTAEGHKAGDAYAEIYWQLEPLSLHYKKDSAGILRSLLKTDIIISADTGIVAQDHYYLQTDPATTNSASQQSIMDFRRLKIPYGSFKISLTVSEPSFDQNAFTYNTSISVPEPGMEPFYSDIQLIDTFIHTQETNNIFYRNNGLQIPLPTNFVDDDRKAVQFYTELYQLPVIEVLRYPLVQRWYISKQEAGSELAGLEMQDTIIARVPVFPMLKKFELSALPSGNYYLNAELTDKDRRHIASKAYFFQLLNNNPVQTAMKKEKDTSGSNSIMEPVTYLDLDKTFLAKYNLQQVTAILEMLLPVSDPEERKSIDLFLKKPDEMYMRYYVYNYFLRRNKEAPEKAWDAYATKVKEVNKLFGGGLTPGYKTERGYIYLRFGAPNDRVIVTNEAGALPYEVWQYYAVGKQEQEGIFLFYQPPSMINDFKLLHSTVTGELKNSLWRDILYVNGAAGNNSRAEQYIRNR